MTNGVASTKAVLIDKTRRKRLKVVSACGECRRKKTKCNGEQPCTGCIKANAECKYALSTTAAGRQAATTAAVGNYSGLSSLNHSANRHHHLIVAANSQRTGNSDTQPPTAGHRAQPRHSNPTDIPKHDHHYHHISSSSASQPQQHLHTNATATTTTAPSKPATPHIQAIEQRLVVIEDILRALLAGHTGQHHLLASLDQKEHQLQQQEQQEQSSITTVAPAYRYKENTCNADTELQPKEGGADPMTTEAAIAIPLSMTYPVQLTPIAQPAATSHPVSSSNGGGGPSIRSLLNEHENADGSPSHSPLSSSSSTSSSITSTSLSPILATYRQQQHHHHHHVSTSAFQRVNATTPHTSLGDFS